MDKHLGWNHREAENANEIKLSGSQAEAEIWHEALCLSAVTELVSTKAIPDVLEVRARARGIAFTKLTDPDAVQSSTMLSFSMNLRKISSVRASQSVSVFHEEMMCTKTCTKMVKRDYAGFGGIPLDSLQKHEMLALKYRELRAIPTSASIHIACVYKGLVAQASTTDTKTDT